MIQKFFICLTILFFYFWNVKSMNVGNDVNLKFNTPQIKISKLTDNLIINSTSDRQFFDFISSLQLSNQTNSILNESKDGKSSKRIKDTVYEDYNLLNALSINSTLNDKENNYEDDSSILESTYSYTYKTFIKSPPKNKIQYFN